MTWKVWSPGQPSVLTKKQKRISADLRKSVAETQMTRHIVAICLLALAAGSVASLARQQTDTAVATAQEQTPTVVAQGPVAVPEPSDQAMRFYRTGMVWWSVFVSWGILIPALILFTGLSARMRNLAQKIGRKWFFTIGAYAALYFLLRYVVDFPLDYLQGFVRQHAYGLSNQSFGQWLGDSLKTLLLTVVIVGLILPGPYFFLKKSPRRWWLYTAVVAVPFGIFFLVVQPIWIAPLYDDFGPMRDSELEADILALADRAGIEGTRVFEVDKSADTEAVNAYVSGFLNTKRIVLWDTIVAKLNREQLLFVMGHEMAHYVLRHRWYLIVFYAVLGLCSLYAAHRSVDWVIRRFRRQFGFDRVSDVASLPLLIILINVFTLVVSPVELGFSRMLEHEADRFGLEITQDNHAAATSWLVLQRENLGNPRPGPIYRLFRASHPVLADRIEFSNTYRPWEAGEDLKYGHLFRGRR